jgi:hypothetical protein
VEGFARSTSMFVVQALGCDNYKKYPRRNNQAKDRRELSKGLSAIK